MLNKPHRATHGEADQTGFLEHRFTDRWSKKTREQMVFSNILWVSRHTEDTFMLKSHETFYPKKNCTGRLKDAQTPGYNFMDLQVPLIYCNLKTICMPDEEVLSCSCLETFYSEKN